MTNREKIRRAFDAVQPSRPIVVSAGKKLSTRFLQRRPIILGAAVLLFFCLLTAAYASNLGGFQETVRRWIGNGGKQRKVRVSVLPDDTVQWQDSAGETWGMIPEDFFPVGPDGGLSQEARSWLECPVELDDYSHPGKVALSFFDHYLDITWPLETAGRVRLTLSHKETAYQIEVRKSADGGYSVTWWEDEKDFDPFVIDPERFEQLP